MGFIFPSILVYKMIFETQTYLFKVTKNYKENYIFDRFPYHLREEGFLKQILTRHFNITESKPFKFML